MKRNRPLTPVAPMVAPLDLSISLLEPSLFESTLVHAGAKVIPDSTPSPMPIASSTSSIRSQERCPNLQRPNADGLLGHQPEIFLDFLWAPSLSSETTIALSLPLHNSANLFTRSLGKREKGFLAEISIEVVVVTAQLHNHDLFCI